VLSRQLEHRTAPTRAQHATTIMYMHVYIVAGVAVMQREGKRRMDLSELDDGDPSKVPATRLAPQHRTLNLDQDPGRTSKEHR
jgi:hypothetical protein